MQVLGNRFNEFNLPSARLYQPKNTIGLNLSLLRNEPPANERPLHSAGESKVKSLNKKLSSMFTFGTFWLSLVGGVAHLGSKAVLAMQKPIVGLASAASKLSTKLMFIGFGLAAPGYLMMGANAGQPGQVLGNMALLSYSLLILPFIKQTIAAKSMIPFLLGVGIMPGLANIYDNLQASDPSKKPIRFDFAKLLKQPNLQNLEEMFRFCGKDYQRVGQALVNASKKSLSLALSAKQQFFRFFDGDKHDVRAQIHRVASNAQVALMNPSGDTTRILGLISAIGAGMLVFGGKTLPGVRTIGALSSGLGSMGRNAPVLSIINNEEEGVKKAALLSSTVLATISMFLLAHPWVVPMFAISHGVMNSYVIKRVIGLSEKPN